MRITSATGRRIRMTWIDIADWGASLFEGSRESASDLHREALADWLSRRTLATFNAAPPDGELPRYQCRAVLESTALDAHAYRSSVIVAWFVDAVDGPLAELVRQIIDTFVWETTAQDVPIDDD